MTLAEEANRAGRRLREADYVRLVAATTGDGAASAVLLFTALRRDGVDAHLSFHDDLAPLDPERFGGETCLVLLDGWRGADLGPLADSAVVLSHDDLAEGATEACAATVAFLVAHGLDKRNADLLPLALAGAFAERQGASAGLHAALLAEGEEAGVVTRAKELALDGPLVAALAAPDPFLKGVAGRARAAAKMLASLRIDAEADAAALEDAERARLASALAVHLLENGAPPSAVDALVPMDARATTGPFAGTSARRVGHALALARPQEAAAALLAGTAPTPAIDALPALLRAERAPGEPAEAPAGGADVVAHLASLFLTGGAPALAWEALDGHARVVARAPRETKRDVVAALRKAAGGRFPVAGTRLAARARVPAAEREAFLAAAKEALTS